MKSILAFTLFLSLATAFAAVAPSKVHFVKPHDKEVVPPTFQVEFAVDGMTVAKAGEMKAGTGHHHLIIDGKPVPKGQVVPKDETHKHFGDAATSTSVSLKPGMHTLTMQFADGAHKSLGEEYATTITVEVK
jgi:endonuclease YncB( thermonuclease family)